MSSTHCILKRLLSMVCCLLLLQVLLLDKLPQRHGSPQAFSPPSVSLAYRSSFLSHASENENTTHSTIHPKLSEVSPLWDRITDDLYTYSAFWDNRRGLPEGSVVRVLGIFRYQKELVEKTPGYQWSGNVQGNMLNYSCYLWFLGQQDPEEGQLKAFIFEEGLKVFVGTYFLCSPQQLGSNSSSSKHSQGQIPYAVSLVPHSSHNTSHKLIYLRHKRKAVHGGRDSNGVCVRPLFGPFTDLAAITQFISYYSTALNISHFYFYNYAISKEVKEFLILLNADDEISIHILPWNIPLSEWEELWDLGSLTALNDCVYRSSGQHDHVAIVDMDEFIVPRAPVSTLGELYTSVLRYKHGAEGDCVLILNAFFCSEFQDDKARSSEPFRIFKVTRREARLWSPKTRSKMVVVPEAVVAVGHHMVHKFLQPSSKNHASPKHVAVLHHYRQCKGLRLGMHGTGRQVLDQESVKDSTILKYRERVVTSRIVRRYLSFTMNTVA